MFKLPDANKSSCKLKMLYIFPQPHSLPKAQGQGDIWVSEQL